MVSVEKIHLPLIYLQSLKKTVAIKNRQIPFLETVAQIRLKKLD